MSRYTKLLKNTILIGVGSFSSKILTFLFVPLYTAFLTTSEYGVADMITTLVMLSIQVLTLTIGEAMMRFALDEDADRVAIFEVGMLVVLAGIAILIAFIPFGLRIPLIAPYYVYFCAYYAAYALYTVLSYYVRGIEKIVPYSVCGIVSTVLIVGLNILFLVFLHCGLPGFLLSYIISYFTSAAVLFVSAKCYRYLGPTFARKRYVQLMLSYSVPMIPNGLSWWLSNSAGLYIITFFIGSSSTGLFSVAMKIPTILYSLSGIFMTAWRISAVDEFGSEESKRFFSTVYDKLMAFCILSAGILILFSRQIAAIMFSGNFGVAWIYVPLLVVAVLFHCLCEFFGTVYTSAKRTSMLFYSSSVGAITNVAIALLLVAKINVMGAVIAMLISYFVTWLIRLLHSRTFFAFGIRQTRDTMAMLLLLIQSAFMIFNGLVSGVGAILVLIALVILYRDVAVYVSKRILFALNARN